MVVDFYTLSLSVFSEAQSGKKDKNNFLHTFSFFRVNRWSSNKDFLFSPLNLNQFMFYNHKNRTTNFPKNINFTIILFIAVSILANACQSSAPDLNGINVELKSERLDIDLYNIDTNAVGAALTTLEKKYPHFLNFYLDTLMGFGIHQNF